MTRRYAFLLAAFGLGIAGPGAADPPRIAIILDDLGLRHEEAERVAALPAPVAGAVLPRAPHAARAARLLHAAGKEVLVHLPMEAEESRPLDPGGLYLDMEEPEFQTVLAADIAAVPHAVGVNNHMGSLLTRHPGHMAWLMRGLARAGGLYYVDSRTSDLTVAARLAAEGGIRYASRDVFLDHERDPASIRAALTRLALRARRQGSAVAIGHPYPETLAALEAWIGEAKAAGLELVPPSELVNGGSKP